MAVHSTGARSAELSTQSGTYVPQGAKIRPLRDQIIVEPLDIDHNTHLIIIEETKPVRGIVKAVGPGCWPKSYDHPDKHRRTKMWDSKHFQPTEVKVGDIVELGSPQGGGGFSFQSFMWGETMHLICREPDICGIEVRQ